MRDYLLLVACVAISACTPDDAAHTPIYLTAPYNTWPSAPANTPIEPGRPVGLNCRQQEPPVPVRPGQHADRARPDWRSQRPSAGVHRDGRDEMDEGSGLGTVPQDRRR